MAIVKISELEEITSLNSNTANTILAGVSIPTGITGKISATTLALGLYSHNPLIVGNNRIVLDNTISQFTGNNTSFLQTNLQNFNAIGSGDYIVTADTGTNANSFIDLGINNSNYSDPLYSSMLPYDGYLYVNGPTTTSTSGNLVIGTASANANISFIAGGTKSSNVIAEISKSGLRLLDTGKITFADGSTQNTAAATIAHAQNIFNYANSVNVAVNTANTFLQANDTLTLTTSKTYTDTANAWIRANYLANTSGATFNGILNVDNKLNVNNTVNISNTIFTATESAVKITANNLVQTPSNDGYMLHITGKPNIPSRVVIDSFGVNTYGLIAGRTARGTVTAPSSTANNDVLMRISGNGWGSTGFTPTGVARIDFVATQDYTDTAKGSQIQFWNTATNSNTLNNIASFNAESATFSGIVYAQKGFIYTPNTVSSNVSTYNLDVANNSVYELRCNSALTLSLSGFQKGKIVDVWLTHYGNNNNAITHGCLATKATKPGTSFNVNVPTVIYLKYYCSGTDLANTFVSITYG
jgi:hypothetical protein